MSTPFAKQYHSHEELTELLKSRGLIIDDMSFATQKISRIGYYRFSAYLYPFLAAYPNVDTRPMGFPANWQDEPLWR